MDGRKLEGYNLAKGGLADEFYVSNYDLKKQSNEKNPYPRKCF